MKKLHDKLHQLELEIQTNKEKFNINHLNVRDIVAYQNSYFKKQKLVRQKIDKYERQLTLYYDLKDLGVIK